MEKLKGFSIGKVFAAHFETEHQEKYESNLYRQNIDKNI